MPEWGQFKGKKKKLVEPPQEPEPQLEAEPEPEPEEMVGEGSGTGEQEVPQEGMVQGPGGQQLSPEQVQAIQVYFAWKNALPEYERADLYRMLMDVLSELIALETYDLDDRIDFLLDTINETRLKVGLEEVEEPDEYDEDEEDDEEVGITEGGDEDV